MFECQRQRCQKASGWSLVDPIPARSVIITQDEFTAICEDATRGVTQAAEGERGQVSTDRVDGLVDHISLFEFTSCDGHTPVADQRCGSLEKP